MSNLHQQTDCVLRTLCTNNFVFLSLHNYIKLAYHVSIYVHGKQAFLNSRGLVGWSVVVLMSLRQPQGDSTWL